MCGYQQNAGIIQGSALYEEIRYVIELERNKTEEAFSSIGCANMTFVDFYVGMLLQTENFRTKEIAKQTIP